MNFPAPRELLRISLKYAGYLLAFFVFAGIVNYFQSPNTHAMKPVSALNVHTLAGESVTIPTSNGKKTVVYFFAPWCTVCKVSMDAVDMFSGRENVQAVAIGLDYENVAELKPYADKRQVPVYAGNRELQARFKVDRYPTVYILNKDGSIAHTMVGYTSRLGIWLRTLI